MNIVKEAMYFAIHAHDGHVRRYTGEPYWFHLRSVAKRVEDKGGTDDMIAAAWLHDTIEDTDTTYGDIKRAFGPAIAGLVLELTDEFTTVLYPDLNRAARKKAECKRLGTVSDEAKVIKVCDLADNLWSIVEHDPHFAVTYLRERADLLEVLT